MYKLIAIDIDGTLLNSYGEISDRNKKAIKKAIDNNIEIVLTSGRMPEAIIPIASQMDLDRYIITGNGATIYNIKNNETIYKNYMSKEKVLEIIDICEKNSVFYNLYTNNSILAKTLNYNVLYYNSENKKHPDDKKIKINIIEDMYNYVKQYKEKDFLKLTICDSDEMIFNRIMNKLKMVKGVDVLEVGHMSRKLIEYGTEDVVVSYFYTEISNNNANKWTAIQELIGKLNIKKEEVMAIGDNINDEQMIKNAGIGIVMGNSSPKMKQISSYVVATNNDDGVAEAIEKYAILQ